jgi:sorting nexin-1/2
MSKETSGGRDGGKYIRGEGADNSGSITKISVVDPQQHGSGVNSYVSYKVNTETDRKQFEQSRFTAVKRYSDFDWLRQHLVRTYHGVIVPPLPEKSVMKKTESTFVEMRRRSLQTFLNRIANHEILSRDETFRRFLQDSADMFSLQKKTIEEAIHSKSGGLASKLFNSATTAFRTATRSSAEERPKTDEDLLFNEVVGYVSGLTPQIANVHKHTSNLVLSSKELSSAMFEFGEAFKVLGTSEDQEKAPKLAKALAAVGATADGISATTAETSQRINVRFLEQVSYCDVFIGYDYDQFSNSPILQNSKPSLF